MPPHTTPKSQSDPRRWSARAALLAATLVVSVSLMAPVAAQDGCRQDGKNMQCNEFGTIEMENQRDIKGQPITIEVVTTVHDTYADNGGRWILFSIRHEPRGDTSPVSLALEKFSSPYGDVVTTRVEQEVRNEVNVWVHVVDVPTNVPITMAVKVGSTERGAFQLESLVMPFDRGYEPVTTSTGGELSLFAYTVLGVNGATGNVGGGGSFVDGLRTPGFTVVPLLGAALLAALLVARRRSS